MSSKEPNQELNAALDGAFDSEFHSDRAADGELSDDQAVARSFDVAHQQDLEQQTDHKQKAGRTTIESRLAEAEREVLRTRADMENFRKRMQRDADQQLKYANMPLVRDLLEVVDNLSRALDAASHDTAHASALREGVAMVLSQLATALGKYGCTPIESVGCEFDPNVHEAITQMSSEEHAAGLVAQEVAAGYLLHDRVVRPSSVIVSTGPKGK